MIEIVFVFAHENEAPWWTGLKHKAFALDGRELNLDDDNTIPDLIIMKEHSDNDDLELPPLPENVIAYGIQHDNLIEPIITVFQQKSISYQPVLDFNHVEGLPVFDNLVVILSENYGGERTKQEAVNELYNKARDIAKKQRQNELDMNRQVAALKIGSGNCQNTAIGEE